MPPANGFFKAVGRRMEQAIEAAGFKTKDAAAKASGLGRMTVYRWCAGEQAPRPDQLAKFAKTMGRPLAWFYDVADEMVSRSEVEERTRQLAAWQAANMMVALLLDVMRGGSVVEAWDRQSGAPEVLGERERTLYAGAPDMIRAGIRQRYPEWDQWDPARQRRELRTLLDELIH